MKFSIFQNNTRYSKNRIFKEKKIELKKKTEKRNKEGKIVKRKVKKKIVTNSKWGNKSEENYLSRKHYFPFIR